jgi:hypothetical protein
MNGKKYFRVIVALSLLLLTPAVHATNLVLNGSFETPVAADCTNGAAVCRNNGIDTTWIQGQNMGGWIIGASNVDLFNETFTTAADGNQWVELNGDYGANGSIYQDISTIIGQKYLLQFSMTGEVVNGPQYGPNGDKTASVLWGYDLVDNITLPVTDCGTQYACGQSTAVYPDTMVWQFFQYEVTAISATTRLQFADNMPWSTAHGMGLDNVSLTEFSSVPLPGAFWLMGLGLSGLAAIRRSRHAPSRNSAG